MMIPDGIKQVSPEVFVSEKATQFLAKQDIEWLKAQALKSDKKRARICLHKDADDPVHEMVIAVHKESYIPPHSHPHKEESLHVIEGSCDVLIFSDEGQVKDVRNLGEQNFYFYRIAKNVIHGLKLKTEFLVFHEVAAGPLQSNGNFVPEWVPDFETSTKEGIAWIDSIVTKGGV